MALHHSQMNLHLCTKTLSQHGIGTHRKQVSLVNFLIFQGAQMSLHAVGSL